MPDAAPPDGSRRSFLDWTILTLGTALAGAAAWYTLGLLRVVRPPGGGDADRVFVMRAADLPDGEARRLTGPGGRPILLVREAGQLWALSAVCTHSNACTVEWDRRQRVVVCPCHGARFDLGGNVLSGPPPRPLASVRVRTVGDRIYVATEG